MRDRIPAPGRENRIRITQDDGTVIVGKLEYDDQATQEGSTYTKGNVLPDDVCWLMDLDFDESEPDDAFRYLALMNATVYGGIAIRVISNGIPLSGITFSVTGTGSVTTDAQGYVFLRKPHGNYTATFTSTLDLVFSPASFQVTATAGQINSYTVEADEATVTQQTFTSSTTINFSSRVKSFDVFCVGAGGSGGVAFSNRNVFGAVSGGAGGYTSTKKGVKYSGESISVNIGAGGSPVSLVKTDLAYGARDINGNSGGRTYVSMGPSTICKADGGAGGNAYSYNEYTTGVNGANGGSGSGAASWYSAGSSGKNGSSGSSVESLAGGTGQGTTTRAFGEGSGTAYSPAGESAVASVDKITGDFLTDKGGADSGAGRASTFTTTSTSGSSTATSGSTKGAGGGGAVIATSSTVYSGLNLRAKSGAGADGLVIIRWRYN